MLRGFDRKIENRLLLPFLWCPNADTEQGNVAFNGGKPCYQTSLGAGAAGRMNQQINRQISFGCLFDQFADTIDIAQRADRIRSATGDDIRNLTSGFQFFSQLFHFCGHIRTAGAFGNCRAIELIQQHIAVQIVRIVVIAGAVFQQDMAFQPLRCGGCRGLACMV